MTDTQTFTREQVEKGVMKLITENSRFRELTLETRLSIGDFDSLELLNITMEFEDEYRIDISDDDAKVIFGSTKYVIPKDVSDYICGRLEIK